jgi:pimeloyl-ACP methyl ester carboxylesterase
MTHSDRIAGLIAVVAVGAGLASAPRADSSVATVSSKDGTRIAVECAGSGPTLVVVHGGSGDRSRWRPLFPLWTSQFTVCAMDRRGHGESGDSADYSLQKEAEDVAAVVESQPGPVYLLGHSLGGVAALEAAFLTGKIGKLVLYEPPVQEHAREPIARRMEQMIAAGNREEALVTFMREIVMVSPEQIAAMQGRPLWPRQVAHIDKQIRQIRALDAYHFDPQRMRSLKVPTLLLTGSKTASPDLKRSITVLHESLPDSRVFVLEGQEHNAMDTVPQQFADVVSRFLQSARPN